MNNFQTMLRPLGLLGLLLLIFGLAGCASPNISSLFNNPTSTNISPDYNPWLHKQPCAPPCWEGITPGVTTAEEAEELLLKNPLFSDAEVYIYQPSPQDSAVEGKWRGTDMGRVGANFDASASVHTIKWIGVRFPTDITIKDIVNAYGNPSHIMVSAGNEGPDIDDQIYYSIQVYYIQLGFSFAPKYGIEPSVPPSISPETTVGYVEFFPTSIDGLSTAFRWDAERLKSELIPWQGTFDFDVYCKLRYAPDELWRCE